MESEQLFFRAGKRELRVKCRGLGMFEMSDAAAAVWKQIPKSQSESQVAAASQGFGFWASGQAIRVDFPCC